MSRLENLPPLRDVLAAHDLAAKKNLGQHFLFDLNLTDKIARLATPHSTIVEVGPGPGGLTRSLLAQDVSKLLVIEKDERFLPVLEDIRACKPNIMSIEGADALRVDYAQIDDKPIRICANLPYNVGTKLVTNWLEATPPFWDRMVLMLQKEVAERLAAKPGDKAFGRLAVLCASVADAYIALDVPARAFTPPPKVDSAVIVIDVLSPELRFGDLETLGKLTAAAFGQRRKMLRKSLRPFAKTRGTDLETWLEIAQIDGTQRPEELGIDAFHRLVTTLSQSRDKAAKP